MQSYIYQFQKNNNHDGGGNGFYSVLLFILTIEEMGLIHHSPAEPESHSKQRHQLCVDGVIHYRDDNNRWNIEDSRFDRLTSLSSIAYTLRLSEWTLHSWQKNGQGTTKYCRCESQLSDDFGDQYPRPNIKMLFWRLKNGLIEINSHKVCKANVICSDIGFKCYCCHKYHRLGWIMSITAKRSTNAVTTAIDDSVLRSWPVGLNRYIVF